MKVLAVSVAAWVGYFISLLLFGQSDNPPTLSYGALMAILAVFADNISEIFISGCILMLVDRHGGMIGLLKYLFCGVEITEDTTLNTSESTNAGGESRRSRANQNDNSLSTTTDLSKKESPKRKESSSEELNKNSPKKSEIEEERVSSNSSET